MSAFLSKQTFVSRMKRVGWLTPSAHAECSIWVVEGRVPKGGTVFFDTPFEFAQQHSG
jgi:hypothetical protein